jgi:hypothetical protein
MSIQQKRKREEEEAPSEQEEGEGEQKKKARKENQDVLDGESTKTASKSDKDESKEAQPTIQEVNRKANGINEQDMKDIIEEENDPESREGKQLRLNKERYARELEQCKDLKFDGDTLLAQMMKDCLNPRKNVEDWMDMKAPEGSTLLYYDACSSSAYGVLSFFLKN